MTPKQDTQGKPVPETAVRQHYAMATGKSSETGAGKGADIAKSKPSTRW